MEESIADIIKTETRFDFKDGAKNLRLMSEVKDAKIKNINWLMFAKKVGEKWINHRNDFVGLVEGSLKTTVNTLYNDLKTTSTPNEALINDNVIKLKFYNYS